MMQIYMNTFVIDLKVCVIVTAVIIGIIYILSVLLVIFKI